MKDAEHDNSHVCNTQDELKRLKVVGGLVLKQDKLRRTLTDVARCARLEFSLVRDMLIQYLRRK